MGQYKVPQNVEAEDKILGPLTLKQFIYAIIGVAWAGLCFVILRAAPILMIIVAAPPTILFMLLAFYQRDGQNFEQLLIALVGFFANSRRRVWRKEEVVETLHIQPRPVVLEQTQRDPAQVRSELDRIATLVDSRGWNQPQTTEPASHLATVTLPSERLVTPTAPATPNPDVPHADMLDLKESPLAQNLASLIAEAAEDVREEAIEQMKKPSSTTTAAPAPKPAVSTSVTTSNANDILKLATQRDDLTVSQIAATATRSHVLEPGETVDLRANGNSAQ